MNKSLVSLVILTFNEEANIQACLESTGDFTDEIFIVDSYSNDNTLKIAEKYNVKIFQNPWTHYAGQRQWALANLPFTYDWLFFLDADERLTPALRQEIAATVVSEIAQPQRGGYYVSRNFIFLGRHLRRGGAQDGLKELRLVNRHYLVIGERAGHEVYISSREVGYLQNPMIHEDLKPLGAWIDRHNRYSALNAEYLFTLGQRRTPGAKGLDKQTADRGLYWKEKFRECVWHKLPFGCRPFIRFFHNYFLKLGFLDGIPGFVYIFLHDFWFLLLVDAKLFELKNRARTPHGMTNKI